MATAERDLVDVFIAPGTRTVSWTVEVRVAIGRHRCKWCRMATPDPTTEQLVEFAKSREDTRTIWPFDNNGSEGRFEPSGWSQRADDDDGYILLCPACTEAHDRAVAQAKTTRSLCIKP